MHSLCKTCTTVWNTLLYLWHLLYISIAKHSKCFLTHCWTHHVRKVEKPCVSHLAGTWEFPHPSRYILYIFCYSPNEKTIVRLWISEWGSLRRDLHLSMQIDIPTCWEEAKFTVKRCSIAFWSPDLSYNMLVSIF
jgi:hypothetical protein